MNDYIAIIPSCTFANVVACTNAIEDQQPDARMVVVANGDLIENMGGLEWDFAITEWDKPFNFAACINHAVREYGEDLDILLLNDDTRLLTPHGFSRLREAAYAHPECGLMFPVVTGCTGNPGDHLQQPGGGVRIAKRHVVPFIGVYIRRAVWDQIGELDERFCLDYGCEDNDYCYRVTHAGYKLGVFDGCLLEHGVLESSYRKEGNRPFTQNAELFRAKHGVSIWDLP